VADQTLSAVHRAIQAGLKRHLGLLAAVGTDDREHLPLGPFPEGGAPATALGLAALPTGVTTGRLVVEPL